MNEAASEGTVSSAGPGEMRRRIEAYDWAASPIGPRQDWPQVLEVLVDLILTSSQPMFIVWGPARTLIYNDAYAEILAAKHPALGQPFEAVWHEIWERDLRPIVENAYAGVSLHMDDIPLMMRRKGYLEETHFSFSYTPVRDAAAKVQGFLCPCTEITEQVLEERRARVRMEFTESVRSISDPVELGYRAAALVAQHLGAEQGAFAEVDAAGDYVTIARDWNSGDIPSNAGQHRMKDFGPAMIADLKAGRSIAIDDIREDTRTLSPRVAEVFAAQNIRSFLNVPQLRDGRLVSVMAVHSNAVKHWHARDIALVEEIAQRTYSAVQNVRADAARRQNEAHLRATRDALALATNASRLGWTTLDVATDTVTFDPCGREVIGIPATQKHISISDWLNRVHPEDREAIERETRECMRDQRPFDLEYRVIHPDGDLRHVHGTGYFQADEAGEIIHATGFVRDVTERKRSEERQNVLMAELDHRVKNILAVVQSIARQSLRGRQEAGPDAADRFIGRISALAQSHSLLASSRWEGAAFHDLVENTLAPYRGDEGERITMSGPRFNVTPKAAQTLTLALHELVTNAAKYGALSQSGGRVTASWAFSGSPDATQITFHWRETGGPKIKAPPSRKGFGSFLIERMLVAELGGAVTRDFAPEGLTTVLELPATILVAESESDGHMPPATAPDIDGHSVLAGKRILVIEDDYLVGQETLAALGAVDCEVIGPVTTLKQALLAARGEDFDAAVLDINLDGEMVWPAAQLLHARELPFVFTTAYSNVTGMPGELKDAPWVEKPFNAVQLTARLAAAVAARSGEA